MKVSLNWISEYVNLSGITPEEIEAKLTLAGLEVEATEDKGKMLKGFIVGYVKTHGKHPNADKLSLCTLSDGNTDFQVVCGAPNVAAGQKVVFATIGATVPNGGMVITKAKIRGVESFGMICSERELGLSENHSGIMVLPQDAPTGAPIAEYLGLNDVIFEIGITPNRPDALSHFGVARDIAAVFGRPLNQPQAPLLPSGNQINELATVEVSDSTGCPRYTAKVITGVTVAPSPEWLVKKLESVGLRPINNVVDVTNYILYDMGQPLHAFDLGHLAGKKIIVRQAGEQQDFTTLDSKTRKLRNDALLICDSIRPVAIAGVMGGENSEVTAETVNILLESAYFNPSSIRKTAKSLGLSTDASYRFERGTAIENTLLAAERAAALIAELGGGTVAGGTIDVYPAPYKAPALLLRRQRIARILGYEIVPEKVSAILTSLGFGVTPQGENWQVTVPSYRPDIEREIDLIEEVVRVDSYDNIPTNAVVSYTVKATHDETAFTGSLRETLTSLGYYEIITNPMLRHPLAALAGEPVRILNPQSADMECLRTSLLPGALEVVARNINSGQRNLTIFEIGRVYAQKGAEITSFEDLMEEERLMVLITGLRQEKEWFSPETVADFFDLKGTLHSLFSKKLLDNSLTYSYYKKANNLFEYYLAVSGPKEVVGQGGKVRKEVLKIFGIEQDVYFFEASVPALKRLVPAKRQFAELQRYPLVQRDFAFIFDSQVESADVLRFIKKNASQLLKQAGIFDVYRGKGMPENKKSMAFALTYADPGRTLTEDEVEADVQGLIAKISKQFDATLRGA